VSNTIFDELQSAGVSWKFYVQNYEPTVNFFSAAPIHNPRGENQLIWDPLSDISRFINDPTLASHIVNLNQYYTDLRDGTLPDVSYIIPSGDSEHPPGNIMAGQRFQRGLVTALMESSAWNSSAFEIAYDDWGGWYDSVVPPTRGAYGDGFRVAAYLISPYARRGYVDHTTLDFTSDLKFIEQNWRVPPLTQLDSTAGSIMGAFDFSKPPRSPQIISLTYAAKASAPTRIRDVVLFAGYGGAVILVLIIIAGSFRRRGSGPRLGGAASKWRARRRHSP
jgi:phospholipase C